jgi:hypothetical protein
MRREGVFRRIDKQAEYLLVQVVAVRGTEWHSLKSC